MARVEAVVVCLLVLAMVAAVGCSESTRRRLREQKDSFFYHQERERGKIERIEVRSQPHMVDILDDLFYHSALVI